MRHRAAIAAVAIAVLVLGATTVRSEARAAARSDDDPVRYVNLGDSYSAGAGILPFAPDAPPACTRSSRNWASVIARQLEYQLTDVSCSGATTADLTKPQPSKPVAAQIDALSADTDLVTMTIGGNDGDVYVDAFGGCAQLGLASLGRGNPCERRFGDSFVTTVREKTYPAVVRALRAVKAAAPRARVAISGYLQILPPDRGCFPLAPYAAGDVPYLNRIEAAFNDAAKEAAQSVGVTYLDVTALSAGHDACRPPGVRYVEPLVPVNAAPAHPNALGERRMAENAIAVLDLN